MGHQLAATESAGGHNRKPTRCGDADLCGLGGKPEFIQIKQRIAERGGIELAVGRR